MPRLLIYLLIANCLLLIAVPTVKAGTLLYGSDTLNSTLPSSKATHTVVFTSPTAVGTGGKIVIEFPSLAGNDTNTPTSASSSTFQLNGLTDSLVSINGLAGGGTFTGTYSNPAGTGSSPTITLILTGSSSISAFTPITVTLGTTPTIISPSKTATAGTADPWVVRLKTQDSSGKDIDNVRLRIGTVENVTVKATVEQAFTMTIFGIQNNIQIQGRNSSCIGNSDITNAGSDSTPTNVSLGNIPINSINVSAQEIIVSTNDKNGYVLTATSASHFKNSESGFSFHDSPSPTVVTAGNNFFGIHSCGKDTDENFWGTGTTGSNGQNKYAWPQKNSSLKLASHPVGRASDSTIVEYGTTADEGVPTGNYNADIFYLATPTF